MAVFTDAGLQDQLSALAEGFIEKVAAAHFGVGIVQVHKIGIWIGRAERLIFFHTVYMIFFGTAVTIYEIDFTPRSKLVEATACQVIVSK